MKLIVIRHSNREHIKNSETAHLAQLTDQGISNAVMFGTKLNEKFNVKIDNIFTSVIERCVETGDLIRKAHSFDLFTEDINLRVASSDDALISLGYVKMHRKMEWLDYMGKLFKENDLDYTRIFKELFEKQISLYKDSNEFANHFFSEYYNHMENNLIVTHDTNIGPLMHHLSIKYNFSLEEYMLKPNPLCGFCAYYKNGLDIIEWVNYENDEIKLSRLV